MVEIEQERLSSKKERLCSVIRYHLQKKHSISLWRLPNSNKKNLIISEKRTRSLDKVSIESLEQGFLFAPFDTRDAKIFLHADMSYSFEEDKGQDKSLKSVHHTKTVYSSESDALPFHIGSPSASTNLSKKHYIGLVDRCMQGIAEGYFEKIVPSRSKTISLPKNFDLLALYNRLCTQYPNAFVSLVSTPETGAWIGASPELLVGITNTMIFNTMAMAGTQLFQPGMDVKSTVWTQKEIEEQALVSRYIVNCFKEIRLREFSEYGPKTWRAGNLLHLKTDFEVDMNAVHLPQLGSIMLPLLHPTSAVCGTPKTASLDFLREYENLDRQFYSGFLGPINYQNESHIFANLRCMRWMNNQATLYAGAGITANSIPDKEWEETEMKMNTLLNVMEA